MTVGMVHRKGFINWLNIAHAMEAELGEILDAHQQQAKDYPAIQSKIQQHLEITREHKDKIEEMLNNLGEEVAETKSELGDLMDIGMSMVSALPGDRLVKNMGSEYAAEYLEIFTYKKLIAAASELEHTELISPLESILRDEEEMARWIDQNIETVVTYYLAEEEGETDNNVQGKADEEGQDEAEEG